MAAGERRERLGEVRVVVRTRDDEAALDAREATGERVERGVVERRRRPSTAVANGRLDAASSRPSGPSGSSGSRNGTLRCTGPAGPASAVATARPASDRTCAAVAGSPSNSGSSANHLACPPVEVVLVDGLRRAAVAQLGRAGRP